MVSREEIIELEELIIADKQPRNITNGQSEAKSKMSDELLIDERLEQPN